MNERTVRLCPYQACGWHYEEPPVVPIRDLSVAENVRVHIAAVEEACRAHLDQAHPGWTLRDVEAEALQAQVSAVFNASPFSPTTPPPRPPSR